MQMKFHRQSSYERSALLFSSHVNATSTSIPRLSDFPHFRCPPCGLSSFVTSYIHRSIVFLRSPIFFSCAFFNAHVSSQPYVYQGRSGTLASVPYTFPLISTLTFLSHNTPSTLFPFFHPLCTMWVHPVLHPPPTSIPGIRRSSLSLLALPVNGYLRLDVHNAPQLFSLVSTDLQS